MKRKRSGKRWLSSAVAAATAAALVLGLGAPVNRALAKTYSETVYEAESATLHNASTNTNHTGYTGSGFVDGFSASGDYVQFSISVAAAGDYTLLFRYANDTGYKASHRVYVDGVDTALAVFPDLASWDAWGTAEVGTYLSSGSHTVKIAYNNHAINLDNLLVTPKHESTRSFYMSNWDDMMAIWKAAKLNDAETAVKGPRIDELHYADDWETNQIKDWSGFFRDETASVKYNDGTKFDSEAYFDEEGVLRADYLKYNGSYPSNLELSRDYVMVPHEKFIVARYALKNNSGSSKTVNVLDMLHVNNTSGSSIGASYDGTRKALVVNMSAASQYYLALGAFATPTGYQAADDTIANTADAKASPWVTFDNNGTLKNNGSVTAQDISVGFNQSVSVAGGTTEYVYFYLALGEDATEVNAVADTARAHTGDYWFTQTADDYDDWFDNAKPVPSLGDSDLTALYKNNLVMIKNAIRPGTSTGDGAMPATTNPATYSYKVWTRDSATTAVALDAAGFTDEGERYWRWLAARQLTGGDAGKFNTTINVWTNARVEFIEPEHDILGWFLYGVYRHGLETGDNTLRDDIWTQLKATADYIMNNIDADGYGPQDFSIWEDLDNYGIYAYTQALYVAGLEAAAKMAAAKGLGTLADNYNGAASTIKTAINRDDTASDVGLWNWSEGYYDKSIRYDGTLSTMEDASGLILFTLGVIDPHSSRTASTVDRFEADLGSDTYGLARFGNDTYYSGDSYFSPAGDEALEISPSWPQMSAWNAITHVYNNESTEAANIFNWFKHRTAAGWMVTGEAVSDVSEKPIVSTASEPVTAAAFVLAALTKTGAIDMRIVPDESNAGAYKALTVSAGTTGDWPQYQYVPYYLDAAGDSSDSDIAIRKVYAANDGTNLVLRIDNESGSLPGFNDPSKLFQVAVYAEDFTSTDATKNTSINGTALGRNMAYLFKRDSDSNNFNKYTVSGGNWTSSGTVSGGQAEWDTATGRIEVKIPLSAIGHSTPGSNDWFRLKVVLSKKIGGTWTDLDAFANHYRVTGSSTAWLFGDFE
ncbi:MAG: carbohydrate-binding protein [Paenibacillaceae bacterium]|nr:carbohydrate-binding protein [Paenibacillaceae bacterium]